MDLLTQFLGKRTGIEIQNQSINPFVYHYFKEIVRYWNRLRFIIHRTLYALNWRSISDEEVNLKLISSLLYATYRKTYEDASNDSISSELTGFINIPNELVPFLKKLQTFSWNRALEKKSLTERLSLEAAAPSFFINQLRSVMPLNMIQENLHSMTEISKDTTLTFRVNTLAITDSLPDLIHKLKNELKNLNASLLQDINLPFLVKIPFSARSTVLQSEYYQSGQIIFQDKASAAVVHLLDPQPDELICDICAAPGLKTSFIAQKMRNTGKIIAVDFHTQRIHQMKKLLNKLQVRNADLINADSINIPVRQDFLFDRVLVDAPCTGSGTFLTNPELKWRQTNSFLRQNTTLQQKLLRTAIKILKSRGILVYSTCSLYPEEGEFLLQNFIDELDPLRLPEWISPSYSSENSPIPGTGRFFPAKHHTQGFFIGIFQKK